MPVQKSNFFYPISRQMMFIIAKFNFQRRKFLKKKSLWLHSSYAFSIRAYTHGKFEIPEMFTYLLNN